MDDVLTLSRQRAKILRRCVEEIADERSETQRVAGDLLFALIPVWETLKPQFDLELGGRHFWDVALSGMRRVALDAPFAWFFRLLASAFGCSEFVQKVLVYLERALELTAAGLVVHRAEVRYDEALARAQLVPHHKEMVYLYTSVAGFPHDEQVLAYVERAVSYERLKLELVVEGPIQLVLSLSDEAITAIVRLPLWLGSREEPTTSDLVDTVKAARSRLEKCWEGGWLEDFVGMGELAIDRYAERLRDRLMRFRALVPTPEAKRRFVMAFDAGDYRVIDSR